jgi:molecular chaperone Hsp31 and glyoxalase 3|tara:strand:- start:113 stop:979 length:867 start_codon:yes stop_codon:yes gene_type:complete
MIKKILGIAPQPTEDGAFSPSRLALKLATSSKTDFDGTIYENPYKGNKLKVLMVCTEERNMTMANGRKFSTGNHPVEMLLPMLHLKNAGFNIDIVTPTGESVKIEMWAMPNEDKNVKKIYSEYKEQFESPNKLSDFVNNDMNDNSNYIAIFIPGGHGAMLGLPKNNDLNKLIHWSHKKGLFMLAICHGPAALLAANMNNNKNSFIYKGYKIAAFPDSVDKQTPMVGYMPGHMPWKYGKKLSELGVTLINKKADKTCYIDKKLVSAASPLAANDFGKLSATELLKEVNK